MSAAPTIEREKLIELGVLISEAEKRRCLKDSGYFIERFCGGWSEATGEEFGGKEWPGQKSRMEHPRGCIQGCSLGVPASSGRRRICARASLKSLRKQKGN